ncbi:MAG: FliA/WhiG family RNA polymerase sigma factor [Deferribacteraceae bacterium]|jgi:RNA polymerase sigma factor for flagellar operon FliA|nr:FliA/WhiG family RNA polymerase sigma factor [Deferribacteraceae bacterium]
MTYSSTGATRFTEEEKNKIVYDYLPQIKIWAVRAKNLLPSSVDMDEIYSAASLGLIECLDKYDKSRNIAFSTYVEHRVKGSILDALRGMDFLSRNARAKVKALEAASEELKQKLGRIPNAGEIAEYTQTDEEEVYRTYDLLNADKPLSLDDTSGDEDGVSLVEFIQSNYLSPEDDVLQTSLTERMGEEIDKLPEKERLVVSLYYYEELTMKEVANVLGITESRVSQLHTAAIQKMKKRLKDVL